MWILYTLIESAALVFTTYVGELGRPQRMALWEDYKVVGELFGLRPSEMPATLDDLDEYGHEMLTGGQLFVSDWARRRVKQIVLDPPVPTGARPLLETINFITIALLPDEIRRQYGFSPLLPGVARKALVHTRCARRPARSRAAAAGQRAPGAVGAAGAARRRCLTATRLGSVAPMTRVAVVGHTEWVDFVRIDRQPDRGGLAEGERLFAHAGGGAIVAAAVLRQLGAEVDLYNRALV